MKILLVAATSKELRPLQEKLNWPIHQEEFKLGSLKISRLITGVGMTATAFEMGKYLAKNKVDLAINVGLAGSFLRNLNLGDIVQVEKDQFSELGAEDGRNFLTLFDLNLAEKNEKPYSNGYLLENNKLKTELLKVSAITVNTVHGQVASITEIRSRVQPQIESMEGAAFFYACHDFDIPCIQIRSISNYVEKRNVNNWNVPLALEKLADYMHNFLNKLSHEN